MSFYEDYLKKSEEAEGITAPIEPTYRNSFSDIQKREEAERREFIKRVKGENVPLVNEEIVEEKVRYIKNRPNRAEKILVRLIIILALAATIFGLYLLWLKIKEAEPRVIIEKEIEEVLIPEAIAPKSLFDYEHFEYPVITRANELPIHIRQYYESSSDLLTRINIRNQEEQSYFIGLEDFLLQFPIFPESILKAVDPDSLNLFTLNGLGLALKVEESSALIGIMNDWQEEASTSLAPLLSLLGREIRGKEFTSQGGISCLGYEDGTEVCYAITSSDLFILATSKEIIELLK